jgi:phage gpG-like protein
MIKAELVNSAEVVARLERIDPRIREELRVGIGRLALKLAKNVQNDKLRGQVLKNRTGRLSHSITNTVVAEGAKVSGIVSTPVKYAPPHEYGFHGTVTIREHMRTVKQAFGRPIDPVQATVRAHEAKMNLPERSFLRSALREFEASGKIGEEISAAIQRAIA